MSPSEEMRRRRFLKSLGGAGAVAALGGASTSAFAQSTDETTPTEQPMTSTAPGANEQPGTPTPKKVSGYDAIGVKSESVDQEIGPQDSESGMRESNSVFFSVDWGDADRIDVDLTLGPDSDNIVLAFLPSKSEYDKWLLKFNTYEPLELAIASPSSTSEFTFTRDDSGLEGISEDELKLYVVLWNREATPKQISADIDITKYKEKKEDFETGDGSYRGFFDNNPDTDSPLGKVDEMSLAVIGIAFAIVEIGLHLFDLRGH